MQHDWHISHKVVRCVRDVDAICSTKLQHALRSAGARGLLFVHRTDWSALGVLVDVHITTICSYPCCPRDKQFLITYNLVLDKSLSRCYFNADSTIDAAAVGTEIDQVTRGRHTRAKNDCFSLQNSASDRSFLKSADQILALGTHPAQTYMYVIFGIFFQPRVSRSLEINVPQEGWPRSVHCTSFILNTTNVAIVGYGARLRLQL